MDRRISVLLVPIQHLLCLQESASGLLNFAVVGTLNCRLAEVRNDRSTPVDDARMNQQNTKSNLENRSWLYRKGPELIGVVLVVTLVGCFLVWPSMRNVRDSWDVDNWRQAKAIITRCYISKSNDGNGRVRRSYQFRYQFQVDDQTFEGWRYSLAYPSGSARTAIDRFETGQTIDIYYDPDSPNRSVVDRSASVWWNYLVLTMTLFLSITALWIRFGRRV